MPELGWYKAAGVVALAVLAGCATPAIAAPSSAATYTNPLLQSGPDPWITQVDGVYYYTHTLGNRIALWRTDNIARLAEAKQVVVWTAPKTGPNAHSIWAPELHRIDGKWFLYYSATASGFTDDSHRGVFVLENDSADPMNTEWTDRGRINTARPGIDGTVFSHGGKRYFVYSPYTETDTSLAIAEMKNPWTLAGSETIIARPDQPWEQQGGRKIVEGPEFLPGPKGDLFLTYSASACWSDGYSLGLLHAAPGSNPLDASVWKKSPQPALKAANGVYATGHNGFFVSPDGKENWIIYHANPGPDMKCTPKRAPRIQRFDWSKDGWPQFGEPVATGVALPVPSGSR
ncbi:glycoside hydrolase family 43 protein [Steroidobacter agaridevorans]|uniref:glycoside hydrolase family 43 protein n=1 Tax=Steroidobacter agaridevorans TaxID=2695856 RepID=UPI001321A246|nr:glycoside hydrolase family 43 protein [Steroidobacter agaridevorans]GFE90027.1 glycosyl hydrolase family 43 [Steroidobacter agaridevorans]